MSYDEEWAQIQASPSFQKADPRDRADLARFFARKRVKPQGGSAASMKFLAANLPPVKGAGRPDTKSGLGEGMREGFAQSAVGMVARGQLPDEGMGLMDAARDLASGAYSTPSLNPFKRAAIPTPEEARSNLRGVAAGVGSMIGMAPDVALGYGAGLGAMKGLTAAGVKAAPAALAASVGTGAAIPGAAVKLAGGTNDQAMQAAGLGAAGGLLPFAGKIPAGKLNPNLTRPGKVGTMPNPGPGRAPQVDMRNTGRPVREVFRGADPPPPNLMDLLPRVPESHRLPAGPMGPQPYPDWMTQGEFPRGGGIQRPGETLLSTGTPGDLARPIGMRPPSAPMTQFPASPADLIGLPAGPRLAQRAEPLALPPAGGSSAPVAVPPGGFKAGAVDAMTGQRGTRPGSAARNPAAMSDDALLGAWQKWEREGASDFVAGDAMEAEFQRRGFEFLGGDWLHPEGRRTMVPDDFSKLTDEALASEIAEVKRILGQTRAAVTRGEAAAAKKREITPHAARKMIGISDTFLEENTGQLAGLERRLQDLNIEASHRARLRGAKGPKGGRPGFALNPAAALGKVADAGARKVAAVGKRLIEDEEGSFDPVKAYQDMGRLAEQARNLWRGTKGAAGAGLRALAPVGNRTSAVERALLGGGIGSAIGERTGATAAGQRVGQAIDTALTVPLTKGPAWAQAVANAARRATQSRYNVPEDVYEQFVRVAPAKAREQFKPTTELAVDLGKRLTSGEQFDLHMQVAEPTYKGPLSPDAQRVQADNQRVSDYLLRLGVITPEEHARWGKHYLPREYAIHEAPAKAEAAKFAAGRAINRIKGTHGRGTFEVVNGQKTWRDYTIPERAKWGERRNVTRALALKKARGEQQAAAAEFLDWVSKQPAYTLDPATVAPGVPKENLPDTYTSPTGEVFRLVSDKDAIPLVHRRVKKYGGVAGKYVREDVHGFIWDQVNLDYIVKAGNMITLNPLWKRLKTIWNAPNYFINNTFHNVPMLLANGGAVSDLPAAAAKVHAGDPLVARLEADGFIRNDAMARELALKVTQILREQNASQMPGPVTLGRVLSDAADNFRALEGEGYNVAQATDDLFRVALVDRLMQDGMPYEQATKRLTDAFYQPDRVTAPAARVLGATAVPFAKVNWYLANALTKATTNDPLRVAQIVMLYYAAPYVMGALQGKGPATIDQEREALPPHMKGTGNALPIQVPGAGVPTWLNLSMANPTASAMETERSATGWPRGFQPGGLAVDLLPLVQPNGVEAFTGKPLIEYDSQNNVVADHRADYVARKFAPGVIGNAYRLEEAMRGKVTPRGDVVPKPVAIARALGLQFQPVDVENARNMAAVGAKADMAKYRAQAARLLRYAQKAREAGDEAAAEQMEREALEFMRRRAQVGEAGQERVKALGGAP